MEREQIEKETEAAHKQLSDLGWEIVEEGGNKTLDQDETTRKTKAQMLREESIR